MINFWSYKREYSKIRRNLLRNIDKTIKGGNVFFGKQLQEFEKKFISKYKSKYGIAVGSGEQAGINTETDRDILAKSDALSVDLHYCYHPIGIKWATTDVNPTRAQLETVAKWSKVYQTKNIGIVRATNVSNQD